jgi:hypothetical protein
VCKGGNASSLKRAVFLSSLPAVDLTEKQAAVAALGRAHAKVGVPAMQNIGLLLGIVQHGLVNVSNAVARGHIFTDDSSGTSERQLERGRVHVEQLAGLRHGIRVIPGQGIEVGPSGQWGDDIVASFDVDHDMVGAVVPARFRQVSGEPHLAIQGLRLVSNLLGRMVGVAHTQGLLLQERASRSRLPAHGRAGCGGCRVGRRVFIVCLTFARCRGSRVVDLEEHSGRELATATGGGRPSLLGGSVAEAGQQAGEN